MWAPVLLLQRPMVARILTVVTRTIRTATLVVTRALRQEDTRMALMEALVVVFLLLAWLPLVALLSAPLLPPRSVRLKLNVNATLHRLPVADITLPRLPAAPRRPLRLVVILVNHRRLMALSALGLLVDLTPSLLVARSEAVHTRRRTPVTHTTRVVKAWSRALLAAISSRTVNLEACSFTAMVVGS